MHLSVAERERAIGAEQSGALTRAHEHRYALAGERAQQLEDAVPLEQIDTLRGLVDEQQQRPRSDRTGDRYPRGLRAVELVGGSPVQSSAPARSSASRARVLAVA